MDSDSLGVYSTQSRKGEIVCDKILESFGTRRVVHIIYIVVDGMKGVIQ